MKTYKNTKILVILSIILLAVFAGCTAKNEKTIKSPGGDTQVSEGSGPDWCKTGTSITSSQQGQYSLVIKGLTTYQGQEVCEAYATFEEAGQSGSMTYYFSEDNKYMHMVMKDASGKVVQETDSNGH